MFLVSMEVRICKDTNGPFKNRQTKPSGMGKETSKGWGSSLVLTTLFTPSGGPEKAGCVEARPPISKAWECGGEVSGENKYPNSLSSWLLLVFHHLGPGSLLLPPQRSNFSFHFIVLSYHQTSLSKLPQSPSDFSSLKFQGLSLLPSLLLTVLQILSLIPLSHVLFCNSPSTLPQLSSSLLPPFYKHTTLIPASLAMAHILP